MKLGLDVAQHQQTWDELLSRVRFAEEAGFDGAWLFDHFKALYGDPGGPCLETGRFLLRSGPRPNESVWEPWSLESPTGTHRSSPWRP
jgi:alkanesulfonate monooxygenase SsuD/methylene tetrahydromethanopterin reductase-like flavin-dependent oxidoreductase (luciferase family)